MSGSDISAARIAAELDCMTLADGLIVALPLGLRTLENPALSDDSALLARLDTLDSALDAAPDTDDAPLDPAEPALDAADEIEDATLLPAEEMDDATLDAALDALDAALLAAEEAALTLDATLLAAEDTLLAMTVGTADVRLGTWEPELPDMPLRANEGEY